MTGNSSGVLYLNGLQAINCSKANHPHEGSCEWRSTAGEGDTPYITEVVITWHPNRALDKAAASAGQVLSADASYALRY